MSDTISIIVPIYNVEPYLRQCIESIINQTYKPIQIVLVDDGSTDGSSTICDYYSEKYANIIVVHQKNSGLSVARNVGIDHAKGEWLAFIDSDDWIEPTFCEDLLNAAITNNVPISMCKTRRVNEFGNVLTKEIDTGKTTIFNYNDVINELLTQKRVRFEVWHKLWRRDLIADIRFIRDQVSEDVHFDRLCFPKAEKMVYVDKTLHNYRVNRPGSTLSSYKKNRDCVFSEFDSWAKELLQYNYNESATIITYIAMRFSVIMYFEAFRAKQDNAEKRRLRRLFEKYYQSIKFTKYNSVSMILFHINPNLFCSLSIIKTKLINEVINGQ